MKIKPILSLFISIIILVTAGTIQVFADAVSDNYNNYVYPATAYKKPVVQPFSLSTSGQTENISPSDGSLEITQTDLSLKGKNGLDFNLTRIYNTSESLLYEPRSVYQAYYTFYVQGYYVMGTETKEIYTNGSLTSTTTRMVSFCAPSGGSSGLPYSEMPPNFPDFVYKTYWPTSQQAQRMADNFNAGAYDTSVTSSSGGNTILTVTKYSDRKDFTVQLRYQLTTGGSTPGSAIVIPEYYWDYTTTPINDKYFNLGAGWSFDLPYIEKRDSSVYTQPTDTYLHLGSEGTVHFTWNYYTFDVLVMPQLPWGYNFEFGITLDGDGVGDMQLSYIMDRSATHTYSNSEGFASFKLQKKDGKILYFGADGRLMAMIDRFGNQIQFKHNTSITGYPIVSQIIDSAGRIINLNYASNRVTVEVADVTNPSNNRYIYYNKTAAPANSSKSILSSVQDTEGRITQYTYEEKSGNFCFRRKDPYPNGSMGASTYECLKSITYPTGGKTVYNYNDGKYSYKNLGIVGFMHFYKIVDRADYTKDGARYNYESYKYYNYFNGDGTLEYDGYPTCSGDNVPAGYQVKTDVTDDIGNVETNTYSYIKNSGTNRNLLLCTDILFLGLDHKKEKINSYDSNSKLLTKTINRTYNKTTGAYTDSIENYQYDGQKNVIYYWDPQANGNTSDTEHRTAFTYGANSIMTSKTYKRDAANTVKEKYTLSSDGKTVSYAQVYENNILKKQTGYIYDAYGNATEQRNFFDDWTNYISVKYDYTDNESARNGKFNGVYITRKWTDGVKDADGNLVAAKTGNPAGTVDEVYKYDWFGNIKEQRDGQNNLTTYVYDKLNRVTMEKHPDLTSMVYQFTCNASENSVLITDERLNQTKAVYDEFGNITYVKDMVSGQYLSQHTYDSLFRLKSENNHNNSSNSQSTAYDYYSDGRAKQKVIKDKAGNTLSIESYSYDDANSNGSYDKFIRTLEGDSNSPSVTTFVYVNKLGQVVKQGRVHNAVEYFDTYKYDYLGNKIEERIARANDENWAQNEVNKYEYNFAGNPTKVINVKGDFTTTQYDALGRVVKVTDIAGNKAATPYSATYVYDNLGRVVKEDIPFESMNGTVYYSVNKHYYDRNGNVMLEKATNNKPGEASTYRQTGYEYNNRNMLTKVITYNLNQSGSYVPENYTQYYYDAAGNKVRMYTGLSSPLVINGLDNVVPGADTEYSVTKYEYDQLNRLKKMTDPLNKAINYTYDVNGNLKQVTDRNGNTLTNNYDGLGRISTRSVATPDGLGNASYQYSYNRVGNRASMNGGGIDSTYAYDDLGRLKTESLSNLVTKEYDYDADDNRKSFKLKQNGQIKTNTTYTYDNLNRLKEVKENGQVIATYDYDANGNRKSLVYNNGNSVDYSYNLANKLDILTNKKGTTPLSVYDYAYYLDGSQAGKTDSTGLTSYAYDGLGRLKSVSEPGNINTAYGYDDANNRRTMIVTGGVNAATTVYSYDKNNKLLNEVKTAGNLTETTKYGYDHNGNQTYKTKEVLNPVNPGTAESYKAFISGESGSSDISLNTFDGFNRLKGTTLEDKTLTYAYNGDGLRIGKTVNGATSTPIWDGDQIALELDNSSNVTSKYVRGVNLLTSENGAGSNKKYYMFNGHGDVVQLSGTDGIVSKNYNYDAFGNEKNPDINDTNAFRYSGEYFDKETDTVYLRARYYDPTIGRFISEDSYLGVDNDSLSLNLYTYCHNDPINFFDPSGNSDASISYRLYNTTAGQRVETVFNSWIWTNPHERFDIGVAGEFKLRLYALDARGDDITQMSLDELDAEYADELEYRHAIAALSGAYISAVGSKSGASSTKSTAKGSLSTQKTLQGFADEVNQAIPGKGPVVGTNKHSLFKKKVDAMGNPSIRTEQTFINGEPKPYGTKGGVRVDAIEYHPDGTITVYDLKTGSASLSQSRITQIQNAVNPNNPGSVTVVQIK